MQTSQSLWEQILLNAVGPVVTVVLGTLAVGGTVSWLQQRREGRQALRELTVEMFRVAFSFYHCVESARRQRRYHEPELSVEELDAAYHAFVIAGRSIEARLRATGSGSNAVEMRWLWHCVIDLLTCLFFHHRHSEQRIRELISGEQGEHELTATRESIPVDLLRRFYVPSELDKPAWVKRMFAQAIDELVLLRR